MNLEQFSDSSINLEIIQERKVSERLTCWEMKKTKTFTPYTIYNVSFNICDQLTK